MFNKFLSSKLTGFALPLLLAASVAMLTGCGGGGSGTTTTTGGGAAATQTITGTVATGAPLAGATIQVKDSAGAIVTGTSAANGTFSIPVTGKTPPFMLVSTAIGQSNMYSVLPAMDMAATNTQNVNITQVTTLVMYELNGGADPASMYNAGTFSTVTSANVSAKETIVRSKLPANTVNPIFSMMHGKFVAGVFGAGANPDPYDAALDAIGKILTITPVSVTFVVAPPYTTAAGAGAVTAGVVPSISMTLTDPVSGLARTSISSTTPAKVTATVLTANGAPVANAIVSFTTSDARDSFTGGANTALTDVNGLASVTLITSNTGGGASTVTASSTVAGTAVTNSLNYAIGASSITLSAITLPVGPLSAYGTASVSVTVMNNLVAYTTPMTVNFSSACAIAGKATLTASVTTVNGVATASYLDNGCNNSAPGDTITATLMNGVSATKNLPVSSPAIGSIQFVSVATTPVTTPPIITLKGTGGQGRSESARVTFRVADSAGNPIGGATVSFGLNTSIGGLTLSSTTATSDPLTGNVITNVLAGTFSTAVRVTATTCTNNTAPCTGTTLTTQSDQLLVTTGVPAQDSFSLSASMHNIEGWNYDGITSTITARLADHFHNPVPDGTAVYFTSEGGAVAPSCTTVAGTCSVVLTSQALRPSSAQNGFGRLTVLARAIGEEAFVDLNSNGTADANELFDASTVSSDIGEAYVDYNEDAIFTAAFEPYINFNAAVVPAIYNGTTTGVNGIGGTFSGDTQYNGILCTTPGIGHCSTQKSIDVRDSQIIIFSASNPATSASLTLYDPAGTTAYTNAVTSYNAALATYNAALTTYNAALATYNAAVTAAAPAAVAPAIQTAYNTALTTYNTALTTYNTAYNTAVTAYYAAPVVITSPPVHAHATVAPAGIVLSSCSTIAPAAIATPSTIGVNIVDVNGNAMPAGTVITFATSNGATPTPASYTVPDTIGCRKGFPGCPASSASPNFGLIPVSLLSNATYLLGVCTNTVSGGTFTVTATTPKGIVTTYTIGLTD